MIEKLRDLKIVKSLKNLKNVKGIGKIRDIKYKKGSISLSALLVLIVGVFAVCIMIACVLVFVTMYNRFLMNTAATNSEQSVAQVKSTLDTYSGDMDSLFNTVVKKVSTSDVQTDPDLELSDDEIMELKKSSLQSYLDSAVTMRSELISVTIYDTDGTLLLSSVDGDGRKEKQNLANNLSYDTEWFKPDEVYISSPHVQNIFFDYYPWVVTMAQRVYGDFNDSDVYISVDIKFSSIASYVDNVGIGAHGYCFVIDNNGAIVYHPRQQLIYRGIKEENLNMLARRRDGVYTDRNIIYSIKSVENKDWKVVGVSYNDEVVAVRMREVILTACFVALVGLGVSFVLIVIFSNMVSRPIKGLVGAMQRFERDATNFQYSHVDGIREIQTLSNSFEHMVKRIQELVEQVKNEEISLRKTELKALQAQINPHFLYNTLDSIQWMCEQDKMQEAVKMVGSLAKLFRISLSKGRQLITIEEEINHAKNYLVIQSFRYKNQFKYSFEVEPGIEHYLCNKITIQPMIENAIYHGLNRMIDEGEIRIAAKSDGDDIIFEITDNGSGMTEEKCRSILGRDMSDSSGIGLKNVDDRLKIYFGEQYGVKIDSVLDVGTKITIRFPKVESDDYEV